MKSWDQLPRDWDHPDCVEYRKAYGEPVYNELYFRLRAGTSPERASGEEPPKRNQPEPPLDPPRSP